MHINAIQNTSSMDVICQSITCLSSSKTSNSNGSTDLYLPPHKFPCTPCTLPVLDPELEPGIDLCYLCRQRQIDWDYEYDNWRHLLAELSRTPAGFDNQADTAWAGAGAALPADSQVDANFLSWNAEAIELGLDLDSHTGDTRMETESNSRSLPLDGCDNVPVDVSSESGSVTSEHWDDPYSDATSDITGLDMYMDIETATSTNPEAATSSVNPATGPVSIAKFSPEDTFACGFNNCTTLVANSSRAFTAHILAAHRDLCTSPENYGLSPVPVDCRWTGCKAKAGYSSVLGAPELWRHVQMHWGGAVHACSLCNDELTRKDSCDRHIKQRHGG